MVIDDLDLEGVTLSKLEADPPALIHSHRPLVLAVAGLRSLSDFATLSASSKSMAASKSSPRNWFGRSPSQTLRVAEFRHDLIMA